MLVNAGNVLLGKIGDHRAADALRRLAAADAAPSNVFDAVRQIETRGAG
jgi:hypothetical protein